MPFTVYDYVTTTTKTKRSFGESGGVRNKLATNHCCRFLLADVLFKRFLTLNLNAEIRKVELIGLESCPLINVSVTQTTINGLFQTHKKCLCCQN